MELVPTQYFCKVKGLSIEGQVITVFNGVVDRTDMDIIDQLKEDAIRNNSLVNDIEIIALTPLSFKEKEEEKEVIKLIKVTISVELEMKCSSNLRRAFDAMKIGYEYHGETFAFSRSGKYTFECQEHILDSVIAGLSMYETYYIRITGKEEI